MNDLWTQVAIAAVGGGGFGAVCIAYINFRASRPKAASDAAEATWRNMSSTNNAWEKIAAQHQQDIDGLRKRIDELEGEVRGLEQENRRLNRRMHDRDDAEGNPPPA